MIVATQPVAARATKLLSAASLLIFFDTAGKPSSEHSNPTAPGERAVYQGMLKAVQLSNVHHAVVPRLYSNSVTVFVSVELLPISK